MTETTDNQQTKPVDEDAKQVSQKIQSQIVSDSEGLKFDAQIAQLFQNMRQSSGLSLEQLSQQLQTEPDILQSLEKGDLNALPDWQQSSQAITRYAALLGIEPDPILRRLALNIQARTPQNDMSDTQLGQTKAVPELQQNPEPPKQQAAKETAVSQEVPGKVSPIYRPVETKPEVTPVQAETSTTIPPAMQKLSASIDQAAVAPLTEEPLVATHEEEFRKTRPKRVEPTFSIQNSSPETLEDNSPSLHETDELDMFGKSQRQANPKRVENDGELTLRADRRDDMRDEGELVRPQMLDLLENEKKGGKTTFWLMFVLTVLALAYIVWFAYSEPRLGKLLLEQLPFLSS